MNIILDSTFDSSSDSKNNGPLIKKSWYKQYEKECIITDLESYLNLSYYQLDSISLSKVVQKVISRIVDKLKKLDKNLAFVNYRNNIIKNDAGFSIKEELVMKDLLEHIHFIMKYFYCLKP